MNESMGDTAEKVHRYNGLKGDLSQSLPAVEGQVQQACGVSGILEPKLVICLRSNNLGSYFFMVGSQMSLIYGYVLAYRPKKNFLYQ